MMQSKSQSRFAVRARLALIPVLAVLLVSLSGKETIVVDDGLDKNNRVTDAATRAIVVEENQQDTLKSREEILQYISRNIKYPADARQSGHIGTVVLFASVNQNGTIKEVRELRPKEGFVEFDEITIIGYIGAKSEHTETYSLKSLKPEGRRVIESFPVLEIPELNGQAMKFTFKFEIR